MRDMKLLLAVAASGAVAQSLSGYGDASSSSAAPSTTGPVYVTETVTDCDTETPQTMITVTNGVTVEYCPKCENMPHTTIYTTVYQSLCSSGEVWSTTPATYTVTETCDHPEPTWTPGPDHIPQGYTVTVHQCEQCATPGPVTITEPCGCEATEGIPSGPAPTSPSGGNGGSGSPGGSSGSGSGSTPTGSSSNNPPSSGGNPGSGDRVPGQATPGQGGSDNPPYPTPTTAGQCPGPQCQSMPTGGSPPYGNGNGNGNASTLTPYEGTASSSLGGIFTLSSVAAVAIGVLAFAL